MKILLENLGGIKLAKLRNSFYISASEAGRINNISYSFVRWLLNKNKIIGAYRIGNDWAVPCTWKYKKKKKQKNIEKKHKLWIDTAPILSHKDPSLYSVKAAIKIKRMASKGASLEKLSKQFKLRKNTVWNIIHDKSSRWDKLKKEGILE